MKKVLIALVIFVILIMLVIGIGRYSFDRMVSKEVEAMFANIGNPPEQKIAEADIEGLPEPVQKYLRFTKVIGKEKIRTVRLKQTGKIRMKPDAKWMPFEAEQYYTVGNPVFIWKADAKMAPLLWISARDKYENGKGNMLVKIQSLIKVVDGKGHEMDQGALSRYLNEIMWFPTAYIEDYVKWESIDSRSARATMTINGITASALLKFDDEGKMVDFLAERYMSSGDKFVKELWSTPIERYKEYNGIMLPQGGKAVWKLKTGDFCYIELELKEIEYNVPKEY